MTTIGVLGTISEQGDLQYSQQSLETLDPKNLYSGWLATDLQIQSFITYIAYTEILSINQMLTKFFNPV